MSGRPATTSIIPGKYVLSVGKTDMPYPPGWVWEDLTNLARLETGHTPSRSHPEYWDEGIAWIGIKDARENHGRVIEDTLQTVSQLGLDNSAARLLPQGTVCLSRTASVGYALIMGREMATSQDFVNWVCGPCLDPQFLMYALIGERDSLFRFGKGTTHTTIYFPEVKAFRLCVPPLPEQRRIVAKIEELFSDLDAGVAALQRARANLKRYRASVLKSAVEGKLTADWRAQHPQTEPASALLQRILKERRAKWEADQLAKFAAAGKTPPKDWQQKYVEPTPPDTTGLPELPEGWCWASVEQLSDFTKYGSSAKTNEVDSGVPVLRMGNIVGGRLNLDNLKYLPTDHDEFPDLLLTKGDLLFNRTNSAELVGKSAVYDGMPSTCSYASYLIAVRCRPGCNPHFMCAYINSAHGRQWVKSVVSQQVGQANVNGSKLQALSVPLPPSGEQGRIIQELAERLSQIDAAEVAINHGLQRAARLRQSILKQAFEGNLVPQDPADEPASVLLERIAGGKAGETAKPNRGRGKAVSQRETR